VSDPRAPAFVGGGSFGVPVAFDLALDETTPTPHLVFARHLDDPGQATVGSTFEPDPLPISHGRVDGDGRPQITGSFRLPNDGPALLLVAGDGLHRLRVPVIPSFDVRLQGFPLASLGTAGELALPSLDITLSPSPPLVRDPRSGFGIFGAFDVDPQARLAVVATGTPHIGGGADAVLFWIDLATTPPRVVEQVRLSELPRHLRIAGMRAVGVTGLDIVYLELGRGQVSQTSSGDAYLDHILSFDGRVVYYRAVAAVRARPGRVRHQRPAAGAAPSRRGPAVARRHGAGARGRAPERAGDRPGSLRVHLQGGAR
jgi:hypothetical protein